MRVEFEFHLKVRFEGYCREDRYYCRYDSDKYLSVTTYNIGPLSRGSGTVITEIRTNHHVSQEPFRGYVKRIEHMQRDRITEELIGLCHNAVISMEMPTILKEVNKLYENQ